MLFRSTCYLEKNNHKNVKNCSFIGEIAVLGTFLLFPGDAGFLLGLCIFPHFHQRNKSDTAYFRSPAKYPPANLPDVSNIIQYL